MIDKATEQAISKFKHCIKKKSNTKVFYQLFQESSSPMAAILVYITCVYVYFSHDNPNLHLKNC